MFEIIATGFLSGIISGMGIGGGVILIPALILVADISQKTAQGINLVYFIPTAICALLIHLKKKNVEIKTALVIGLCGILGSIIGSWAASTIADGILRKIFGIFLGVIGIYEIFCGLKGDLRKKQSTIY